MLGFPFIFRGALDVRATAINEEMKIAAAHALAELAREAVPEEVAAAYGGDQPQLRARLHHPRAVRPAADRDRALRRRRGGDGDRRRAKADRRTWTPIASSCAPGSTRPLSVLSLAYEAARANPKRVLFAEGEEPNVLRAAIAFKEGGYGTPVLVGREDVYDKLARTRGRRSARAMRCSTAATRRWSAARSTIIYAKHQRHGMLRREVERMVNQDRNTFAAAMLALGEGDAMITGTTRPFSQSLNQVRTVIDDEDGATPFGINIVVGRHRTVLIADTAVTERPTAEQFAAIAMRSAAFARRMGQEPRVAFISYTTFGNPPGRHIEELRDAVKLLDTHP